MKLPPKKVLLAAAGCALLIGYTGGFISQILSGYAAWRASGGIPGSGTSPPLPSLSPAACMKALLNLPYGPCGLFLCSSAAGMLALYHKLSAGSGEYDTDRNFSYAACGTYGTSGWMTRQELHGVLELVHDLHGHTGTILGMLDSEIICVPENSRLNRNIAVYGVSGSMKTRSYCLNRILQGVATGESLVINDPKSELYETTSEYLASKGYSNAYWPEGKEYDDNEPPLCQSVDGKQGHGEPGGACATCILNTFGSSSTGRGKACKNMRVLYLLRSGEYMPLQLTLSPTSISPFREFMSQAFVALRRSTYGSLVEIGLKRMNNGNDYSVATFRRLADFSGEQLKQITAYALSFRNQIRTMNAQRAVLQQEMLETDCQLEGEAVPTESDGSFCVASTVDGDKMPLPA